MHISKVGENTTKQSNRTMNNEIKWVGNKMKRIKNNKHAEKNPNTTTVSFNIFNYSYQ